MMARKIPYKATDWRRMCEKEAGPRRNSAKKRTIDVVSNKQFISLISETYMKSDKKYAEAAPLTGRTDF